MDSTYRKFEESKVSLKSARNSLSIHPKAAESNQGKVSFHASSGLRPSIARTISIYSFLSDCLFRTAIKKAVLSTFLICLPFNSNSANSSKSLSAISLFCFDSVRKFFQICLRDEDVRSGYAIETWMRECRIHVRDSVGGQEEDTFVVFECSEED